MAKEQKLTNTKVYLVRLVQQAGPSHCHNEKIEARRRCWQKEELARLLLQKYPNEQTIVFCDDIKQANTICDSTDLDAFLNGTIKQVALKGLVDINPKHATNILVITSNITEAQLTNHLQLLLGKTSVTLFLFFHARTSEEWIISSVIDHFDASHFILQDVPAPKLKTPEESKLDEDFDRVKVYHLPYKGQEAEYKFRWNDGFPDIYYTVSCDGNTESEGDRYNTLLQEMLNKEFNNTKPTKKLTQLIRDLFDDDDDFDVIFKNEEN